MDDQPFDPQILFYEVPLATSAGGSFWYLSGPDFSEQWERESLLGESESIFQRIQNLIVRFKKNSNIPVYFDFGKQGIPHAVRSLNLSHCVCDPIWDPQWDSGWHERGLRSQYWKVHRWHSERWIQKYSKEDINHVFNAAERFKPRFLIFAHSQRRLQYLKLFKRGNVEIHRRVSK